MHPTRDVESPLGKRAFARVANGTRTRDHRDHNPGLYQLSYRHRAPVILAAPRAEDSLRCDGESPVR